MLGTVKKFLDKTPDVQSSPESNEKLEASREVALDGLLLMKKYGVTQVGQLEQKVAVGNDATDKAAFDKLKNNQDAKRQLEDFLNVEKQINAKITSAFSTEIVAALGANKTFDIDNNSERDLLIKQLSLNSSSKASILAEDLIEIDFLLDQIHQEKMKKEDKVISEKQQELDNSFSELVDLDNDNVVGSIRGGKEKRHNVLQEKQDKIDQDQKDRMHTVRNALKEGGVSDEDADLVINLSSNGQFQGLTFGLALKKSFVASKIAEKKKGVEDFIKNDVLQVNALTKKIQQLNKERRDLGGALRANKEKEIDELQHQRKELKTKIEKTQETSQYRQAKETLEKAEDDTEKTFDDIRYTLESVFVKDGVTVRDLTRKLNRFEKKNNRIDNRRQNKREYNMEELNVTEDQINTLFQVVGRQVGFDVVAKALSDKLQKTATLYDVKDMPTWASHKEYVAIMKDEAKENIIRDLFKKELPYLNASTAKEWLFGKEQTKQETELTQEELHKINSQVDNVRIKDATTGQERPLTEEEKAGVRPIFAAAVSSYFTGLGGGLSFDVRSKIIDNITVGLAMGQNGKEVVPGVAINLNKNINLGDKTALVLNGGLANFIIPYGRVDLKQVLNANTLNDLHHNAKITGGIYAEATLGYVGAGINLGTNLEQGIMTEAQDIFNGLYSMLEGIPANKRSVSDVASFLQKKFPKGNAKDIKALSQYVAHGFAQGYSVADIAASYAQHWQDVGSKNTKGEVDFGGEVGAGLLGGIPVVKVFLGLGIYRKATMRTDKEELRSINNKINTLQSMEDVRNPELQGKSNAEKLQYMLGAKKFAVSENASGIITIGRKSKDVAIYDQMEIFVKDPSIINVTDDQIKISTFSNMYLGQFVNTKGQKIDKLYLGYDQQADKDLRKEALNTGVNGKPENVQQKVEITGEKVDGGKKEFFTDKETVPNKDAIDQYFVENKKACIDATNVVKQEKYTYNAKCMGIITSAITFNNSGDVKDFEKVRGGFANLMKSLNVPQDKYMSLAAYGNEKYLTNKILNLIAYSSKAWNLNIENTEAGQLNTMKDASKAPKNISELINRKGAVSAFELAGIKLDKNDFGGLHEQVKGQDRYKEVAKPNVIALVAYYRNIAQGKSMNMVGVTGFNGVSLAANKEGNIFKEDISHEGLKQTIREKALASQPDKAQLFAQIDGFFAQNNVVIPVEKKDTVYMSLLTAGKITVGEGETKREITLEDSFYKAFNGPCVNEAICWELKGISITGYTTQKERRYDAEFKTTYETVTGAQQTHKVNMGVGYAGQIKTETVKVKNPHSGTNTGNIDGNGTEIGNNNTSTGDGTGADDPWRDSGNDNEISTGTEDTFNNPNFEETAVLTEKKVALNNTGVGVGVSGASGSKRKF